MSDENNQIPEPPKNRGGRPPATHKLLAKIHKLERELIETKSAKLEDVIANEEMNLKAFSVIYDEEKRVYNLVTVSFDIETGLGRIERTEKLADSFARYMFEMKKLLANNAFLMKGDK